MSDERDEDLDYEAAAEESGHGGMLAIVLLIIAVLLMLFLFRDELGFGEDPAISIPDKIEVEPS